MFTGDLKTEEDISKCTLVGVEVRMIGEGKKGKSKNTAIEGKKETQLCTQLSTHNTLSKLEK